MKGSRRKDDEVEVDVSDEDEEGFCWRVTTTGPVDFRSIRGGGLAILGAGWTSKLSWDVELFTIGMGSMSARGAGAVKGDDIDPFRILFSLSGP